MCSWDRPPSSLTIEHVAVHHLHVSAKETVKVLLPPPVLTSGFSVNNFSLSQDSFPHREEKFTENI